MSADRKRAASVHARRLHYCICGKVVAGNGGKSSHRRTCYAIYISRHEAVGRVLCTVFGWGQVAW